GRAMAGQSPVQAHAQADAQAVGGGEKVQAPAHPQEVDRHARNDDASQAHREPRRIEPVRDQGIDDAADLARDPYGEQRDRNEHQAGRAIGAGMRAGMTGDERDERLLGRGGGHLGRLRRQAGILPAPRDVRARDGAGRGCDNHSDTEPIPTKGDTSCAVATYSCKVSSPTASSTSSATPVPPRARCSTPWRPGRPSITSAISTRAWRSAPPVITRAPAAATRWSACTLRRAWATASA